MNRKIHMKWNDFQEKVNFTFKELRANMGFADVTLVCEDGQQFKAHKAIISTLCPFFSDILRNDFQAHPFIYMMGVRSAELSAIIDFLYKGESTVGQEILNDFLDLAKRMRVIGLSKTGDLQIGEFGSSMPENLVVQKGEMVEVTNYPEVNQVAGDGRTPISRKEKYERGKNEPTNKGNDFELEQLNKQILTLVDEVVMVDEVTGGQSAKIFACKECGKTGPKLNNIRSHIEAMHVTGFCHFCNSCGKAVKTRDALKTHQKIHHPKSKEAPKFSKVDVRPEKLADTVMSMIEKGKTVIGPVSGKPVVGRICKVCGKEGGMASIMRHIEHHHISTSIPHSCEDCGKQFNTREALKRHKSITDNPGPHRCVAKRLFMHG